MTTELYFSSTTIRSLNTLDVLCRTGRQPTMFVMLIVWHDITADEQVLLRPHGIRGYLKSVLVWAGIRQILPLRVADFLVAKLGLRNA